LKQLKFTLSCFRDVFTKQKRSFTLYYQDSYLRRKPVGLTT